MTTRRDEIITSIFVLRVVAEALVFFRKTNGAPSLVVSRLADVKPVLLLLKR